MQLDTQIEATSDLPFYTVGETFTGSWQPGGGSEAELVGKYVSDDQLYGQFDFPMYWPIRGAFATEDTALSWLGEVALGTHSYYGAGSIMSSFLGNHDVSRFISEAAGDIPEACLDGSIVVAWDCPPAQPTMEEPYERIRRAFTFLAAHSAIPLIYYGDEIGLAGAGDPDNRRMMPWENLNAQQLALRESVSQLMAARKQSLALRRGTLAVPSAGDAHLAIARKSGDEHAFALFNRASEPFTFSLPNAGVQPLQDAFSGEIVTPEGGQLSVTVPARGTMLLTQP